MTRFLETDAALACAPCASLALPPSARVLVRGAAEAIVQMSDLRRTPQAGQRCAERRFVSLNLDFGKMDGVTTARMAVERFEVLIPEKSTIYAHRKFFHSQSPASFL
jgi:hypothetical protein